MPDGNSGIQIFGKPFCYLMNNKILKKAHLHKYPQHYDERQDCQQQFEKYFIGFFQDA
jgi:hypothetical protein